MSKEAIVALTMCALLFLAGAPAAHLSATQCWASDRESADPTFTLDVTNQPLRGVLGSISKKTGWKIKAPEKWMDKQVTQTLNEVTLEKGLRYILRDAGVENLLLTYDENIKVVTIFDTELRQERSAPGPDPRITSRPSVPPPTDPILSRKAKEAEYGTPPPGPFPRGRRRTFSSSPEDE
jgi:hypothetical protein